MPNVNTKCVPESWLLKFHGRGSSNPMQEKVDFTWKLVKLLTIILFTDVILTCEVSIERQITSRGYWLLRILHKIRQLNDCTFFVRAKEKKINQNYFVL